MTKPSKKLKIALEAVKMGAKVLLSYYNTDLKIETKADKSVVTKADKESEQVIMQHIAQNFPDTKFLGEESGGSTKEKSFWIIDPLDGTRSFLRKIPTWGILLAHCENGEIVLGVAYFPALNTIAWAEKNKGAFIDGTRVHVSKIDKLNKSYVGFGFSKNYSQDKLIKLMNESYVVRNMATYTAYLVAQGSMEVYFAPTNKLWDFAPFKVILEEAGGKVSKLDGSPLDMNIVGGILSNGLVHDEVVKIVNK